MARQTIHTTDDTGARIADTLVQRVGSWRFIMVQSVLLCLWLILNTLAWSQHWDPYPFILLNLMLSFQAAYTGPIVLLSQNRQAQRDRTRDDREAQEVQRIYDTHQLLLQINQQQLEILTILHSKSEQDGPS